MEYPPVCSEEFSLSRRRLLVAGTSFAAAFAAGLSLRSGAAAEPPMPAIAGWDAPLISFTSALADTIIPATETPGAVAVGAPAFLELIVRDLLAPADRASFLSGVQSLARLLEQQTGAPFLSLPVVRRTNELARFDGETYTALANGSEANAAQASYLQLKEYTLVAFFTSQQVATTMLDYSPVPGTYEPDLPLTPQTRAFYEDGGASGAHLNAGKIL